MSNFFFRWYVSDMHIREHFERLAAQYSIKPSPAPLLGPAANNNGNDRGI